MVNDPVIAVHARQEGSCAIVEGAIRRDAFHGRLRAPIAGTTDPFEQDRRPKRIGLATLKASSGPVAAEVDASVRTRCTQALTVLPVFTAISLMNGRCTQIQRQPKFTRLTRRGFLRMSSRARKWTDLYSTKSGTPLCY